MQDFLIQFDPSIPPVRSAPRPRMSIPRLYTAAEAANTPELDPRYKLAGRTFGYYPAHVTTVLADMLAEAEAFAGRVDHGMTLSGYTVLLVEFRDGKAVFRDPVNSARTGGRLIAGGYDPDEIAEAFRSAADAVWAWVFPNG
jgi:hypothetical protein